MKKLIILTAVTSILLIGRGQQAWANDRDHDDRDDYRAFRKIVKVLDVLVNDDCHRRGRNYVYVKAYHGPIRPWHQYYDSRQHHSRQCRYDCHHYDKNSRRGRH